MFEVGSSIRDVDNFKKYDDKNINNSALDFCVHGYFHYKKGT